MKSQKGYAIAASLPRSSRSIVDVLKAVIQRMKRWHELAQQRRQLAMLSDAGLKDLGLSRADIMEESERPFWNDPLKR